MWKKENNIKIEAFFFQWFLICLCLNMKVNKLYVKKKNNIRIEAFFSSETNRFSTHVHCPHHPSVSFLPQLFFVQKTDLLISMESSLIFCSEYFYCRFYVLVLKQKLVFSVLIVVFVLAIVGMQFQPLFLLFFYLLFTYCIFLWEQ